MNLRPEQFDKSNRRETTDIVWTVNEQEMLTAYTEKHSDDLMALGLLFMLQTGLAISELVGLQPRDVDIEKRRLTVNRIEQHFKDETGKTVYKISKDGYAKEEVRLKTMTLNYKAVDTYKRILALSSAKKPTDFIFDGKRCYDFDTYARRHVLKELGISQRGNHSLRKSYATNLIEAGVKPMIVKEQMRHADITTTLNFYYKSRHTEEEKIKILDSIA